jgi:hypothetical protein
LINQRKSFLNGTSLPLLHRADLDKDLDPEPPA